MLANALRGNTTIKSLTITANPEIDEKGLSQFVPVLRNGETIEGTTNSNHRLIIRSSVSPMPPEYQRLMFINWSTTSANQGCNGRIQGRIIGKLSPSDASGLDAVPYSLHGRSRQ